MTVRFEQRDSVAIMTLDRPSVLNALSFKILNEIGETLDSISGSNARVLIVTGAGSKAFCAGADIPELMGRSLIEQKRGAELGQAVFAKLDTLPMPSIAAINGFAFGGGLELALACTFRIAAPTAKMGLPEIKLGLIPGYGGTQRLPRAIGEPRALELIMTGRTVAADEAQRIGLVHRIADGDILQAAVAFAKELGAFSLPALGFARSAVRRAYNSSLTEGLQTEAELSTLAFQTADADEGMRAFVEKRKAEFKDA